MTCKRKIITKIRSQKPEVRRLNRNAGPIAVASFIAFAASGVADALTYHALRERAWTVKVNGSNVISAAVDSAVFPTLAFGMVLPWIMLGQFVAKVAGGAVWALILPHNEGRNSVADKRR